MISKNDGVSGQRMKFCSTAVVVSYVRFSTLYNENGKFRGCCLICSIFIVQDTVANGISQYSDALSCTSSFIQQDAQCLAALADQEQSHK